MYFLLVTGGEAVSLGAIKKHNNIILGDKRFSYNNKEYKYNKSNTLGFSIYKFNNPMDLITAADLYLYTWLEKKQQDKYLGYSEIGK